MIIYHRYKVPRRCLSKQQNIYSFNDIAILKMKEKKTGVHMNASVFRNNGCLLVSSVLTKQKSHYPKCWRVVTLYKIDYLLFWRRLFLKLKTFFLKLIILCRKCFPLQIVNKNTKNSLTAKTK